MKTLVDIPERQIEELAALAEAKHLPRTELIRQAIAEYIVHHRPAAADAFGIWKNRKADGLAYQKKLRAEW